MFNVIFYCKLAFHTPLNTADDAYWDSLQERVCDKYCVTLQGLIP